MIEAEIILDTRTRSKNGFPLKIRVYCTKIKKHKYIALKKYQTTKKLKVDNFVSDRGKILQKEVDYCNSKDFDLDRSQILIKDGLPKTHSGTSLFLYLDDTIKEREDRGMSTTAFEALKKELGYYTKDVNLNEIDYNWVRKFITHKKKTGTGDGGVSFYIRTASGLYNEAIRRGLVEKNPFVGHSIKRKRTKPLILPKFDDIRKLMDFEGYGNKAQKQNMVRAAKTFCFQIHMGGHYLSDFGNLDETKLKGGRLMFQRYKNRSKEGGGELVDNMMSGFTKEYLEEYGLWFANPKSSNFKNYRDSYNKTLKRISEKLEIEPHLNSSMPRYIFRSAGGQSRASEYAIYQLMGHKPQGVSFGYQSKLPYDVLDEEHQRILDFIFGE